MENTQQPSDQTFVPDTSAPVSDPQYMPLPQRPRIPPFAIVVGAIVLVLLVLLTIVSSFMPRRPGNTVVVVTPTPTQPPLTPSVTPELVPMATQSAFLGVEQAVMGVSKKLSEDSANDTTLAPPDLELPLGFQKQ